MWHIVLVDFEAACGRDTEKRSPGRIRPGQ